MPGTDDYLQRVNRAIDHVRAHLTETIRLADVAAAAGFSEFHFHRVFRSLMGETLNDYVKRIRLDRALSLMLLPDPPSLTRVALASGFGSSSDFSRSFKQRFGVPPSVFDAEAHRRTRREELVELGRSANKPVDLSQLPDGTNPDGFRAVVRTLPPRAMAYRRVIAPYRPNAVTDAAKELVAWAEARGLADGAWYGYMWEDPEVVPLEDCRYDVAVEVAGHLVWSDPEVGRIEFPEMRVATLLLRGDIELEQRALDWLFRSWLPRSGHLPAPHPCFEAWCGRPFAHGYEHFELEAHLPIL
ncbi:MAG: helix-turn-helix domain-containing protein [Planctomycetota bacterium]